MSTLPQEVTCDQQRGAHLQPDSWARAFDTFVEKYEAKYPKPAQCLKKDRDELLVFYDFPAAHWHTFGRNPIESTFATVRLRSLRRQQAIDDRLEAVVGIAVEHDLLLLVDDHGPREPRDPVRRGPLLVQEVGRGEPEAESTGHR